MSHAVNEFITRQAERVIKESSMLVGEMHKDLGERQAEYIHIGSAIITNILFSLWSSVKVMSGKEKADEFIDDLTKNIKKTISERAGLNNG